jgi:hypothetical protein
MSDFNTYFNFPTKPVGNNEATNTLPTLGRRIMGDDLQVLGENILAAVNSICGNPDFMILTGVNGPDGGGNYTEGIILLYGTPYYFGGGNLLNKYLIPSTGSGGQPPILINPKLYSDNTTTAATYKAYIAIINNTSVTGASPQFVDSMNQYRGDLNSLLNNVNSLLTEILTTLRTSTENDITLTITNTTPVVGSASVSSYVHAVITNDASGSDVTYSYNIGDNTNIVYFDLTLITSDGNVIFNIYDNHLNLIHTIISSGGNNKLIAINLGETWAIINLLDSSISTINSEISSIDGRLNIIEEKQLETPTDLGDKSTVDFTTTDFINDSNIHSLDISSKGVPANAKFILIRLIVESSVSGNELYLLKYGYTHLTNAAYVRPALSDAVCSVDVWVPVDANQKISYVRTGLDTIYLTIAGWM